MYNSVPLFVWVCSLYINKLAIMRMTIVQHKLRALENGLYNATLLSAILPAKAMAQ